MKKWTNTDIEDLKLGLSLGMSHEEIGECLGRTKSSIMHKTQKLKLSIPNTQWKKCLTKEEVLDYIRKYKTSEAMDYTEGVPGHRSCQRILGVSSWAECLEMAGITPVRTAKFNHNSPTRFYIVEFTDTDGTIFNKFGITQRTVQQRYSKKDIKIVFQLIGSLSYCQELETAFSKLVISYRPKDTRFYNDTYGGYSECYINWRSNESTSSTT